MVLVTGKKMRLPIYDMSKISLVEVAALKEYLLKAVGSELRTRIVLKGCPVRMVILILVYSSLMDKFLARQ